MYGDIPPRPFTSSWLRGKALGELSFSPIFGTLWTSCRFMSRLTSWCACWRHNWNDIRDAPGKLNTLSSGIGSRETFYIGTYFSQELTFPTSEPKSKLSDNRGMGSSRSQGEQPKRRYPFNLLHGFIIKKAAIFSHRCEKLESKMEDLILCQSVVTSKDATYHR
jgi:hypothetical protein